MKRSEDGAGSIMSSLVRLCLVTFALGVVPVLAAAGDKDQVRTQAQQLETQMRSAGEPRDRCFLNANIANGPVVIRTSSAAMLKPGDRLVSLNQIDLAGKQAQDVIALLRAIEPTAVIPITLDRQGELLHLEVPCSNARPMTETVINALNQAGRGKFDECVATASQMIDPDTQMAMLKAQCAAVSRSAKKYDVPGLLAQAITLAIEDGRYAPDTRVEIIKLMRAAEATIVQGQGTAGYQALVDKTHSWPDGERLYETSGPDWALFRRNAEAALRARLIDPESARIEWTHGFLLGSWRPFLARRIDGYWTCGLVNARNRMGGYAGSSAFVVVLDADGTLQYVEIGGSKDFDLLSASCSNSVKLLPPPPAALLAATNAPVATNTPSVADEINKLVELKNSGALTESEFQAAKQRLLGARN